MADRMGSDDQPSGATCWRRGLGGYLAIFFVVIFSGRNLQLRSRLDSNKASEMKINRKVNEIKINKKAIEMNIKKKTFIKKVDIIPQHLAYAARNIDWTDDIFKRQGWDNDPIVVEEFKLLFFTIPKNTCSEFKMLFRRMMGFSNWKTEGALSIITHNPYKNGLKYLGSYSKAKQVEFMTSHNWTRAIFLRDPRERVLSAYIDKGLGAVKEDRFVAGGYVKKHCCGLHFNKLQRRNVNARMRTRCLPLTPFEKNNTIESFPFSYFVKNFMGECRDPHWAPQHKRMKATNWNTINFIGHMDTLQEDAHNLLKKIGAFDAFSGGWGPDNGTIFETNFVEHATSAKEKNRPVLRLGN